MKQPKAFLSRCSKAMSYIDEGNQAPKILLLTCALHLVVCLDLLSTVICTVTSNTVFIAKGRIMTHAKYLQ